MMAGDKAGGGVPKIKGVSMVNAVRALRSMDKDKARELLPRGLHKYLEDERILALAWYPEEDMLELNRALARLLRPTLRKATLEETYVHMGRLVAEIDLSKTYAALQRGSMEKDALMQRMAAGWQQYHDTGSLEARLDGKRLRVELRDFGLPSRELCGIQAGYISAYLERTFEAQRVTVVETTCRNRGGATCVWDASWT